MVGCTLWEVKISTEIVGYYLKKSLTMRYRIHILYLEHGEVKQDNMKGGEA